MKPIAKRLLIVGGIGISIVVCVVALLVGFYIYVTRTLNNDARLGDGAVTTVITGHFGPVAIAGYLFQLGDGAVGLVDAGQDNEAVAIHEALARLGKRDSDVRVILLTHAHNDHAARIHAFPSAEV